MSLFSLNMWLYSFFLKLLPCLVLTTLTACLIRALYEVSIYILARVSQMFKHNNNNQKYPTYHIGA